MGGWLREDTAYRLRAASGLVLFAFAILHLLNHALGLVSLDAMLAMQSARTVIARSWPGTVLLAAALFVHVALSLIKLAGRVTWRMEWPEAAQITLGLLIPVLLVPHVIETRGAASLLGVSDTYLFVLARLWPGQALSQTLLVALVWTHGCAGLHTILRRDARYQRVAQIVLIAAVVVPLAALAGFSVAARDVALLAAGGQPLADLKAATKWPDVIGDARLAQLSMRVLLGFGGVLLAVGGFVAWRQHQLRLAPTITVTYIGGPTITTPIGPTLLDISRLHGIPHAAICDGRNRCSTCRVRIDQGLAQLPAADVSEKATLASIDAPANVRLACQVRPRTDITVARLLRGASVELASLDVADAEQGGVERILVLMFLDIRNFTRHMEQKLPYDVIYILNEFFAATGRAITTNGGVIDKFLGDGLLAVFGRTNGPEAGCREALQAARAIDLALDHFNARMGDELFEPMRVGVGIHAGPLLLGRIGWGDAIDMTVIGHTVNAASRLEALTKQKGCQLIISRDVANFAGWMEAASSGESIEVRGVAKPIEIIAIARGRDLPPQILGPGWSG